MCHSIRFLMFCWPIELRSDVLMSFMREKMRSHSDVSAGMSSEMTTRRSTRAYSSHVARTRNR